MRRDKIDGATVLAEVCAAVAADELGSAAAILREKLPFQPVPRVIGSVPLSRRIAVFVRDGFICSNGCGGCQEEKEAHRVLVVNWPLQLFGLLEQFDDAGEQASGGAAVQHAVIETQREA